MSWLRFGVVLCSEIRWLAAGKFLKMTKLLVKPNALATEENEIPWVLQTLVIHRRHSKIMIFILLAVCVCRGLWAAQSCILLFFYSSLGHFIFQCQPHE